MEPIDAASERLNVLLREISDYKHTLFTEQDARVKVIDRVLTEVLGWRLDNLFTEDPTDGGFLDYRLDVDGRARLVLEAKRDGRDLGIAGRSAGRAFVLSGPIFKAPAAKEGIQQAIRYCGQKNAELACVTNGREWIVFRGSRCGDGRDTSSGMAYVFPSLDGVVEQFALFYDLLGAESVKKLGYLPHFQEAEGQPIRASRFKKSVVSPTAISLQNSGPLIRDMGRVMNSFFSRLIGDEDPELLADCFVTSRESQQADEQLARIAAGLADQIQRLDTDAGGELSELLDRVAASRRNEFVIIVGTKGAGKSTFIDRFFRFVLSRDRAEKCVVMRVNLAESEGDVSSIATWLNRELVAEAEQRIFDGKHPTFDEIRGLFFDEYRRLSRGPLKTLYDKDKEAFYLEFGRRMEDHRGNQPHDYIRRLVSHIVTMRKKVPVLVFDNADHFGTDFQEAVYQYARSIYEKQVCVVLLPITDRTSWELSRHGALQSFEHEALFLPTPPIWKILSKRVLYLEKKVREEKKQPGRGYFFGRGITLDVDNLAAFCAALQRLFLGSDRVSRYISFLANHDVRRALTLTCDLVLSPHLRIDDLVKSFVANDAFSVPDWRFKKALIRGKYENYPVGEHKFVQNIFAISEHYETTPLLGVRLLQMLRDAPSGRDSDKYIGVDQVHDYLRAMGIEPRISLGWLDALLKSGLCLSHDPTVVDAAKAERVRLSPSGHQHLMWAVRDEEYLSAMGAVTPLVDESAFQRLELAFAGARTETWKERLEVFVAYLLAEDARWVHIPDHKAYDGQVRIAEILKRQISCTPAPGVSRP